MRMSDLIRMGLRNLSRRKARTALTVIGVVIGTISIVVMVSIGLGMNQNFKEQIMELGSLTSITVTKYADITNESGEWMDSVEQELNEALVEQIRSLEHVKAVTPMKSAYLEMETGRYNGSATLYGVDFDSLDALELPPVTYGTLPTSEDKGAIIMGGWVPQSFYNPNSRYYEQIIYEPDKMKLICSVADWNYERDPEQKLKQFKANDVVILEQTNGYGDTDYSVYMDMDEFVQNYSEFIKTLKKTDRKKAMAKLHNYSQIQISVDNVKNVPGVQQAIKDMGYQTSSLSSMFEPVEKMSKMLQLVLGAVGAVAMIVSAISIANTMVMSIYERTKEIGVMKVLGCVLTDVKKLFLFESGMIGLIGGVIGIIISYIASFCINKFGGPIFSALMSSSSITGTATVAKYSIIPFWLPFAAALFAMGVGVLSGYYPASRATKISAIEAMKAND